MSTEQPSFIRTQLRFAAHIRDPDACPPPAGIEERRLAIYRRLFYNNVENFAASGFPILRSFYNDEDWHALVHDFFTRHRCKTPLFLEIAREFLDYLEHERPPQPEDPPFALELAHYEWVELALYVAEDDSTPDITDGEGDLLADVPVLSSLAWPLSYHYPVHTIDAANQPAEPGEQPTYLIAFRGTDDEVQFLEINPTTARLLTLLTQEPAPTGEAALLRIADESRHPDPEVVVQGGRQILEQLREQGIIVGSRPAASQ